MASNDQQQDKDDKTEDLSKEEEDKVYDLLQTSSSLLESAATHKNRMHHSFGASLDFESSFALGDDDDDDVAVDDAKGKEAGK